MSWSTEPDQLVTESLVVIAFYCSSRQAMTDVTSSQGPQICHTEDYCGSAGGFVQDCYDHESLTFCLTIILGSPTKQRGEGREIRWVYWPAEDHGWSDGSETRPAWTAFGVRLPQPVTFFPEKTCECETLDVHVLHIRRFGLVIQSNRKLGSTKPRNISKRDLEMLDCRQGTKHFYDVLKGDWEVPLG
ncbi:hypothetical protein RRG08_001727 [Elysia crispata]|uniref:Uncharacterized protein n=1 Tax=Elysia crispata TaxID=231223 RepID=A0AAE1AK73_9GAST|nr:hypothetical protein RRG08_001727 [Elysia crispata]